MIFRLMEKYRVPILLTVLIGMVGFGGWALLAERLRSHSDGDPDAVYATFEIGGDEYDITKGQYYKFGGSRSEETEDMAAARIGRLIREQMLEVADVHVSDDEFAAVLKKQVQEPIEQQNEGRFDKASYVEFCNDRYRVTPEEFEKTLREDLRMNKMMRQIDRRPPQFSSDEILEEFKKEFQRVKLRGVFFSTRVYEDQIGLPRGEDDELTDEARKTLKEYWDGLTDAEKKKYHQGGAIVTTEFVGFDFKKFDTDDKLDAEFKRVDETSGKSLEQLCADFEPTEDDLTKLKLRFGRHRDPYGLAPDDDHEKLFEERKNRLVQEWKIIKLMKRLHDQLIKDEQAGTEIDFAKVAADNNLATFKWDKRPINDIVKSDEFGGRYAYQLQATQAGKLLNWRTGLGPNASAFDMGPVDEVGLHTSIFRVIEVDRNPTPRFSEAVEKLADDYEKKEGERLRDEEIKRFEAMMDEFLDEHEDVKKVAEEKRKEAQEKIAEETKDLDEEKDKERYDEVVKQYDDEADTLIEEEKDKHRAEAFNHAADAIAAEQDAEKPKVVVIEEGYFLPQDVSREQPFDYETSDLETLARSVLRREVTDLTDKPYSDTFVDPGTVSGWVDARSYPGVRGMAVLVEKKDPPTERMFTRPNAIRQAEYHLGRRAREGETPSMWDYSRLKGPNFGLVAEGPDADIQEAVEADRRIKEQIQKVKDLRAAAKKKEEEARKKAMEEARKKAEEARKAAGGQPATGDGPDEDVAGKAGAASTGEAKDALESAVEKGKKAVEDVKKKVEEEKKPELPDFRPLTPKTLDDLRKKKTDEKPDAEGKDEKKPGGKKDDEND